MKFRSSRSKCDCLNNHMIEELMPQRANESCDGFCHGLR